MFTGIVTAIGTVESVEQRSDLRVRIACPWNADQITIGASIACSGVCLTVVERGALRTIETEHGSPSMFRAKRSAARRRTIGGPGRRN